jgi:hypothetical protein
VAVSGLPAPPTILLGQPGPRLRSRSVARLYLGRPQVRMHPDRRLGPHQRDRRPNAAGRDASPTAAIIDTQSVKITESGGPRGWDAAKRLKGRKRHVAVIRMGCCSAFSCTPPVSKMPMPSPTCCGA